MKLPVTKKGRFLLGAAILGLLAAALLAWTDFDGEALKERIIAAVYAEKQRELRIDGALRLKFLPRLAVEMNDVRLLEKETAETKEAKETKGQEPGEFLRIGKFRGALEILPLLWGKIVVNRIEIHDLSLAARRHADGSTNFDDLLVSSKEEEDRPLDLEIGKLVLFNGRLTWHDESSGRQTTLHDVYLRSGQLGIDARGRLEARGKISRAACLPPECGQDLPGEQEQGQEDDLPFSFTLDSHYRIIGKEAIQGLQLEMPRMTLKTQAKDDKARGSSGNAREETAMRLELTARQLRAGLSPREFAARQLRLEGKGTWQGEALEASLELDELEWAQDAEGMEQTGRIYDLTLDMTAGTKDAPLSVQIALPALESAQGRWTGEGLSARIEGRWQDSAFSGRLELPLTIQQDAQGVAIAGEAMTGEMNVGPGAVLRQAVNARFAGKLTCALSASRACAGEGRLDLDESGLDLRWKAEEIWPLRLAFQASLDRLDIDRYWANTEESADKAADAGNIPDASIVPGASIVPDVPKTGASFAGSVEGTLKIASLHFRGMQFENLDSRLVFADGRLEVTPNDAKPSPPRSSRPSRPAHQGRRKKP